MKQGEFPITYHCVALACANQMTPTRFLSFEERASSNLVYLSSPHPRIHSAARVRIRSNTGRPGLLFQHDNRNSFTTGAGQQTSHERFCGLMSKCRRANKLLTKDEQMRFLMKKSVFLVHDHFGAFMCVQSEGGNVQRAWC